MSRRGGRIWKSVGRLGAWERFERRVCRSVARRLDRVNQQMDREGRGFKVVASQRRRRA